MLKNLKKVHFLIKFCQENIKGVTQPLNFFVVKSCQDVSMIMDKFEKNCSIHLKNATLAFGRPKKVIYRRLQTNHRYCSNQREKSFQMMYSFCRDPKALYVFSSIAKMVIFSTRFWGLSQNSVVFESFVLRFLPNGYRYQKTKTIALISTWNATFWTIVCQVSWRWVLDPH